MMESRFDTNDFERSLKEQADKFFLIPSERVWNSIYNDLHPGSKWPSLAVGLILLVSLFWIGNTHKDTVEQGPSGNIESTVPQEVKKVDKNSIQLPNQSINIGKDQANQQQPSIGQTVLLPLAPALWKRNKEGIPDNKVSIDVSSVEGPAFTRPFIKIPDYTVGFSPEISSSLLLAANSSISDMQLKNKRSLDKLSFNEMDKPVTRITEVDRYKSETKIASNLLTVKPANENGITQNNTPAVANKKKKKRKTEWTFFATPERTTVHFGGYNLNKPSSGIVANPYSQHDMTTKGRYGFQIGTDANYKLTKTIELTSGFHLNYTGYDIMAELIHPSLATVSYRNAKGEIFTKNYISIYGNNGNGSLKITNYNMQFAIPIGLQWTLFEQDNIKVSVVSTVEPFLVLGSKAYILSGDGKKLVNDPDIMRKMNLNGNFGSVVTFSSHKVDWKIGPSIRYQVLSTYHNIYPVKEHLINYGIRIGISKPD